MKSIEQIQHGGKIINTSAFFVSQSEGKLYSGDTEFSDNRFLTAQTYPFSSISKDLLGKERQNVLLIDSESLSKKELLPKIIDKTKISGFNVWLLETITDLGDLADQFLGNAAKIFFPLHTLKDQTLDDIAFASDSSLPAILCKHNQTFDGKNIIEVLSKINKTDFSNVLVMDCDGSIDDETWDALLSIHEGLFAFCPARNTEILSKAPIQFTLPQNCKYLL